MQTLLNACLFLTEIYLHHNIYNTNTIVFLGFCHNTSPFHPETIAKNKWEQNT